MVQLFDQLRLLIRRISNYYPLMLIAVGLTGIIVTGIILGRSDLAVRSLVLVIPLTLAGSLLIYNSGSHIRLDLVTRCKRLRFGHLTMIFILSIIISIIILYINPIRQLEYFALVSLISGLIFLQILQSDSKVRILIILVEISVLLLSLIWGVTLNYPLYYGWTDILPHLYYIGTIVDTNHINGLGGNYTNFPIFHILISIAAQVGSLPIQTTLFIVMGLIWPIGIIITYLIFKNFVDSIPLVLIGCLFFALNAEVIQYGMYTITRSLAFIFYLYILLLLISPYKNQLKAVFLQIVFVIALVLTHHYTALLIAFIFILLFIITNYIVKTPREYRISGKFVFLYGAALFSYLVIVANIFTKNDLVSKLLSYSSEGTNTVGEVVTDPLHALSFIVNNSYAGILFFLSLLGIGYILMKTKEKTRKDYILVLICLIPLIFYIPGQEYFLLIADVFLLYRFKLLLAPFVVFGMAIGVRYLLSWIDVTKRSKGHSHKLMVSLCTVIVIGATFSSILSNSNSVDSDDLNYNNVDSGYFSTPEITSMLFMHNNAHHSIPLYSDYYVIRDRYHLHDFDSLKILTSGKTSYIQEGYVILRVNELYSKGSLEFSDGPYSLSETPTYANIVFNLQREGAIYDNRAIKIYIIEDSHAL